MTARVDPPVDALPGVIVVTGTDTDVGKTVATAAIAAALAGRGRSVAAYKPTQTGVPTDAPADVTADMAEVARLAGVPTREGCRLAAPMAPRAAAALERAALPRLADHVTAVTDLAAGCHHVLVEGAGGLLVELTEAGETLADLALALPGCGVVVVARATLGTLNHTMLTREALCARGLRQLGVVVGSLGPTPSVIEQSNVEHLRRLPEGVLGVLPERASRLDPARFRQGSTHWLPGLAQRMGTSWRSNP
ncbi:MAG TPA: dethiobiotin synthase [Intrasporangium sp.]|uniref:dethiobiotin synthase n=1 Tax=Intrasporangium sp. TaxID=1925024 RepID=UPI002D79277F|nr:dethiobiotin synthase [Intrasporangium sp.]HET7397723.1 dethiobiotin synthase [Intrasporangium sp.]